MTPTSEVLETAVYCQTEQLEHHYSMAFLNVMVIRDLLFVVLVMWSSIYMVTLLYKHRQRAQHLHSLSLSPQSSPEIKATHTILLLSCLKKPIDVIFIHLTLVNVLTILFKLIPDVMPSFGERYFLDDVGLYCQTEQLEHHYSMAFLNVMVIRDLLFVVLMMWSSIYMVTLLYKHRQRAQHLHSLSLSPQSSPEIKATHTILLLGFLPAKSC
ncbi:hypothetical protein JEQ12_005498 [Ovis aries]|uniref:Vomeronasal type-1 receptor n=1 Tax=Ovis aries TaxID=9940 RepID=A0A836A495_SHEEP|nr:hypothetical protein JEQ12_005498 [Ovis aries]